MKNKIFLSILFVMSMAAVAATFYYNYTGTDFDATDPIDARNIITIFVNQNSIRWKDGDIVVIRQGNKVAAYRYSSAGVFLPTAVPPASGGGGGGGGGGGTSSGGSIWIPGGCIGNCGGGRTGSVTVREVDE